MRGCVSQCPPLLSHPDSDCRTLGGVPLLTHSGGTVGSERPAIRLSFDSESGLTQACVGIYYTWVNILMISNETRQLLQCRALSMSTGINLRLREDRAPYRSTKVAQVRSQLTKSVY